MNAQEKERSFLSLLGGYLVSLPSDLKVLQEAVADPNLDRPARELAAGAIVHTLLPQEGDGPFRFVDDVLLVRAAFQAVSEHGGEGAEQFRGRFSEVYGNLDEAIELFAGTLGDTWTWLAAKVPTFPKLSYKGRRADKYVDDDDGPSQLYDEGLEFETNYNVTEQVVQNRLRRLEQVTELLAKKRADEARKIG